jgi:hypothetical protein
MVRIAMIAIFAASLMMGNAFAQRVRPGGGDIHNDTGAPTMSTIPSIPTTPPQPDYRSDDSVPSIRGRAPSAGGNGGGLPPEAAHPVHGHCHDKWICSLGRFDSTDNYPVGSNVSGITVAGRWVPGPCVKRCE